MLSMPKALTLPPAVYCPSTQSLGSIVRRQRMTLTFSSRMSSALMVMGFSMATSASTCTFSAIRGCVCKRMLVSSYSPQTMPQDTGLRPSHRLRAWLGSS